MNILKNDSRLLYQNSEISRLCLGCAQLGMDYGIANRTGGIAEDAALDMLRFAAENGINVFDTAQAYGESEKRIGRFLKSSKNPDLFRVVTKVNPASLTASQWKFDLQASLSHFGQTSLFCLMAHRMALLNDPGWEVFVRKSKADGTIMFSGASIYTPDEFELALRNKEVDIIQAPINPFDDRLCSGGLIQRARDAGKLVFFRSIFLQGALLMKPDTLPDFLEFARPWLSRWNETVGHSGLSAQEILFRYVWKAFPDAAVIFGAETIEQIRQNLNLSGGSAALPNELVLEINALKKEVPLRLLNPAEWKAAS